MSDRDPWIKFYLDDWCNDEQLMACSLEAQGFLVKLMRVMHYSQPYGYLLQSYPVRLAELTQSYPVRLAKLTGTDPRLCKRLLAELLDKQALKTDEDGRIFSKRMLSDRAKRDEMKRRGALGGNPTLLKQGIGSEVKQELKPDKEVEQNKNKNPPISPQGGFAKDFEEWWKEYPNKQGKTKAQEYYVGWRKLGLRKDEMLRAVVRYKAYKKSIDQPTYSNGSTFLNPNPMGSSATVADYLDKNWSLDKDILTCGSCLRNILDGDSHYCRVVGHMVAPKDKACEKHSMLSKEEDEH